MRATRCRLYAECVENRLDLATRKAPVDCRPQRLDRRAPRILRKVDEHRIEPLALCACLPGEPAELFDQFRYSVMRHKVRGNAAIEGVGRPEPGAGQTEIAADLPGTAA